MALDNSKDTLHERFDFAYSSNYILCILRNVEPEVQISNFVSLRGSSALTLAPVLHPMSTAVQMP